MKQRATHCSVQNSCSPGAKNNILLRNCGYSFSACEFLAAHQNTSSDLDGSRPSSDVISDTIDKLLVSRKPLPVLGKQCFGLGNT